MMANISIDTIPVSKLRELISLKEREYRKAIKNEKTFEAVRKIFEEKKELEKELLKKENRVN